MSGSGKSSLVSQALVELVGEHLGQKVAAEDDADDASDGVSEALDGLAKKK